MIAAASTVLVLGAAAIPILSTHNFQGTGRYLLMAFPTAAVVGERLARRPAVARWVLGTSGVLMVVSEPAKGIEAQRILFERLTGYRNKQGQQWGIPVWEFAKKGAGR